VSTSPDDDYEAGERPRVPTELLARLRADPARAPEHLALAAADLHGPAAQRWVEDARSRRTVSGHELARRAKRRHAALSRWSGAATGIGGWMTMVPDLAALAWIQSRMVFFVAAAYGSDPTDPMRPAELLVLQGLYEEPGAAREALDGAGRSMASALVGRRREGGGRSAVSRLARMAGKRMGERVAGRLVPGFAIFFNAVTNERDTRALADRAMRFYES